MLRVSCFFKKHAVSFKSGANLHLFFVLTSVLPKKIQKNGLFLKSHDFLGAKEMACEQ